MKFTAITTALCGLTLLGAAHAHEGHEHPPKGKEITEVIRTGNGQFTYETVPGFGKLPENAKLGPTHGGVAVDKDGLIYVSTDGEKSMCVFKPDGTFVKAIASEARGIHGMQMVTEGDKQFIYGAQLNAYGNRQLKEKTKLRAVKVDLEGNVVMEIPNEKTGEIQGGTRGITGIAVAPDGSIFVSMGYGSNLIHKFDKEGKLLKTFGGRGAGENKFKTCHGLGIDTRFGEPRLLVCDRENRRLVHLDLEGNWIGVHSTHLRRPCSVSFFGDYCAVAELEARVVILDKNGTPVSFVGDNPNKKQWAGFGVKPEDQTLGIFTAPHGLSFDKEGNLYVQDWNATGRVSKMQLVK
ncbi:hypothetical protein Rhal01_01521 [Rubritalea halochordaticola]|uniref:6-bladed beta-propeller n=1 Tax=Rubritalea halochordaticola TaxID=714537 RepID=A0ABP9UY13_9BACT